jgi:hypothetical protein
MTPGRGGWKESGQAGRLVVGSLNEVHPGNLLAL